MGTTRKRSAAITLVLAGSAALSGCGEPESQRDVYTKLDDCSKDWGNPAQCEPVRDGKYSNTYFYGPRYYGASYPSGRPRASTNAIEAAFAGRGGVTQMARAGSGSSFSSGASSSSSYAYNSNSPVSRSGFGSSARAPSGGG
jgi:hypothetical protein